MTLEINSDPNLEWLDFVNPVGLVIASRVIEDLGLTPIRQNSIDSKLVEDLINQDENECALTDSWQFMEQVLGWNSEYVAGAPNGPPIPEEFNISLPEHGTVLFPDWAVKRGTEENPWQLLVMLFKHGVKPDDRTQSDGWEATPHQRFERLLRDSGVFAGLMILSNEFRLVYAPKGETSGYISFPIRPLATVAGRPMLAGLKLLLDKTRLFLEREERRLPAILKSSREAQVEVSTKLADQVLGALHELLRGFYTASPELTTDLAKNKPDHLYDGLLTILMRLVFILYAEDRDLLPSRSDKRAREIYELSYSLRGLYTRLVEDESLNPDTMDERHGAWGQMLVLFRMIYGGCPVDSDKAQQFVISRGGKLFNPDEFLFIEGRNDENDEPKILSITDGCVLRILTNLMTLQRRGQDRERLSYRTLDVEQIGSVYETIMGFTVEVARNQMIAIKAGKNNKIPVFVNLNNILNLKGKRARTKYIKDHTGRDISIKISDLIDNALTSKELCNALEQIIDERGSPNQKTIFENTPILQPTHERRGTGSHYTPRELTEKVVKFTFEPIFKKLGDKPKPHEILELKVCDPAMGSGAFLVEVCRTLGKKLTQSWRDWPQEKVFVQEDDEEIYARRLIATNCIYGVDRNPRAVDLAKLSLWLASLAKGEEFTFLDHALKCGDSLVGLSNAQLENATWEKVEGPKLLMSDLLSEKVERVLKLREKIKEKAQDYSVIELVRMENIIDVELSPLRNLGDSIVASFFKFDKDSERKVERTRIEFIYHSKNLKLDVLKEYATDFHNEKFGFNPFHWELEFPEVFNSKEPGFDAIIGNPPFAGKNTIANNNRRNYIKWLQNCHINSDGNSDLVAHFFRKSYMLLKFDGVFGLIATSTINEGDTRASGLSQILCNNGSIFRAQTRFSWPGEANVLVSIVYIKKGQTMLPILNGKPVQRISAYLVEGYLDITPKPVLDYDKKSFVGSFVLGEGFIFDDKGAEKGVCENLETMEKLLKMDSKNSEVIFPFIGGEEVNSSPTQKFHRYIINFYDRPLKRDDSLESWFTYSNIQKKKFLANGIVPYDYPNSVAADWPDLLEILRNRVKPIRDMQTITSRRIRWWQYAVKTSSMVNTIKNLNYVFATARVTKHWGITKLPNGLVYSDQLVIFAFENYSPIAVLQSRIHELWARFFSSSMGIGLRYTPSDCFDTFPFPENFENSESLEIIGKRYHDFRANLMTDLNDGLTNIYNRFHDKQERDPRVMKLRELHTEMDHTVLRAFGWDDLIDRANPIFIDKNSEEGKQIVAWYDWPMEIKNEVFARLLDLNYELTKDKNLKNNLNFNETQLNI